MVLSKALAWALRHRAESLGLRVRSDGYIRLSGVLAVDRIRKQGFTAEDVRRVVAENDKQRFSLVCEQGDGDGDGEGDGGGGVVEWIRANQGHSLRPGLIAEDRLLREVREPPPVAIHGTTLAAWKLIQESGLSRMRRHHVHMAREIPAGWKGDDDGDEGKGGGEMDEVEDEDTSAASLAGGHSRVSGIRPKSEVLIYVDCARAMAEGGLAFFESANGVLLTPGDSRGFIAPAYFARVRFKAGCRT